MDLNLRSEYGRLKILIIANHIIRILLQCRNPSAMQETWVQFLGPEDPLEEEKTTHSSILAWKIPWTEKPGRLQSLGLQESDMT